MVLRLRKAIGTTVYGFVNFCAAIIPLITQLTARTTTAAIWLVGGVGAAAAYLDTALLFAMQAAESCAAGATQFFVDTADWILIGMDRLTGLLFLLPSSIVQVLAVCGVALSGPTGITISLIVVMMFLRIFTPRVSEFLNDILATPLAICGIAYAITQARRR